MPAIELSMQEFRGQGKVAALIIIAYAIIELPVMLGVESIEALPGMNNMPLLNIHLSEERIQFTIMSAFIPIHPHDDRRMIDIVIDHLPHQFHSGFGIVMSMPSGQFIEHEKSQRITDIQKMIIRWIVTHPHRIHIHFLHQQYVFLTDASAGGASGFRPECMTIDALEFHPHTIYVDPVA